MLNNPNMFWAVLPTSRWIFFFYFDEQENKNVMVGENLNIKTPQSVDWLKTEHTASQTEKTGRQLVEKEQAQSMPTGRGARPIVVTTGHAAELNMIEKASCFLSPARRITAKMKPKRS